MGFFDDILKPVLGGALGLLGPVGLIAQSALDLSPAAIVAKTAVDESKARLAAGEGTAGDVRVVTELGDVADISGVGRKNVTTTTIKTVNAQGVIVKQEVLKGRPFIMMSDIVIAKRVIKQSGKLAKRIPRKTVKQSETSQLKDSLLQEVQRRLITGPSCPPS